MVSAQFFRIGDPPPIDIPGRQYALRAEPLKAFADSVRMKERWYRKVIEQKGLIERWVQEAQLPVPDHPDVLALVRELKYEARRICIIDHAIRLDSPCLLPRAIDMDTIHAGVRKTDLYLRSSKYGIDKPRLYEDVGAYFADDVVPQMLHQELVRELDALAAMEPKDFHPGAGCKVQDLIHPSLYPYTAGVTPLPDGVTPASTEDGRFVTYVVSGQTMGDYEVSLASAYAWIPAVFAVSPDGTDVTIEGNINGLGSRQDFPTLYALLEQAFLVAMPMLEHSTQFEHVADHQTSSFKRFKTRCFEKYEEYVALEEWNAIKERQRQEKKAEEEQAILDREQAAREKEAEKARYSSDGDPGSVVPSIWADRKLKVIVKAANYHLEPGQEYAGTWHMEGMPHERIVASAIYYYERDDTIVDAGLYLRRKRGSEEWPCPEETHRDRFRVRVGRTEDSDSADEDYEDGYDFDEEDDAPSEYGLDPPMGDLPSYLNVGIVPTINEGGRHGTGRIISFPNWVQHRVMSVYNDPAASSSATRKILCFFLVDDSYPWDEIEYPGFRYRGLENMKVLTSSDVPSQARVCNLPTLGLLLRMACRQVTKSRRTLPVEVAETIVSGAAEDAGFLVTREEAENRRRLLMEDRKVQTKDVNGIWVAEYSLCEH